MSQLKLTPEQQEVLYEATGGSNALDLVPVPGYMLPNCLISYEAWTDGSNLVFVGKSLKDCEEFICHLGASRVAVLEARFRDVTVYSAEDDRLSDYLNRFVNPILPTYSVAQW